MSDRVLKVTLTIPVDGDRNLNRGTTRERLEPAATAFLKTARGQGVGVDLDGATMEVEYSYLRFRYQEPIKAPRAQRRVAPASDRAAG